MLTAQEIAQRCLENMLMYLIWPQTTFDTFDLPCLTYKVSLLLYRQCQIDIHMIMMQASVINTR